MRIILVFILLAFGLRPSADNSQQTTDNRLCALMVTSCTVPELVEGTTSDGASHNGRASNNRRAISVDNPEDIMFVSLIYTRLGRLFYNENYCDLAVLKYKKALDKIELIKDTISKANALKELGNSYQLYSIDKIFKIFYYENRIIILALSVNDNMYIKEQ